MLIYFFHFSSISNLEVPTEPLIPANPEVPFEDSVNHQPSTIEVLPANQQSVSNVR